MGSDQENVAPVLIVIGAVAVGLAGLFLVRAQHAQARALHEESEARREVAELQRALAEERRANEELRRELGTLEPGGAARRRAGDPVVPRPGTSPQDALSEAWSEGDGAGVLAAIGELVDAGHHVAALRHWEELLASAEELSLNELEILQAMTEQEGLMRFLLTDVALEGDVRDLAAQALSHLDQGAQLSILDDVFADHGLQDESGRPLVALIGAMSGFEDGFGARHLPQLVALIDAGENPGLDHFAAITLAASEGPAASEVFDQLADSGSAWVGDSWPVLQALHRPHVDHGAYVISSTASGQLTPGDAVVEVGGQRVDGWKDLQELVEAASPDDLLDVLVVDVEGNWVTRQVNGKADLRCLGRDL